MGLIIDHETCILCGACAGSCPGGALKISDRLEFDEDKCVLCGVCADNCPVGAITLEKEQAHVQETSGGVWVAVQQAEGQALPVAFELLGKGRELADTLGCPLYAVCIGKEDAFAPELIAAGADEVLCCKADWIGDTDDGTYAQLLTPLIRERKPEIVLFGATMLGRAAAPRVAAALQTGLTADCTALNIEEVEAAGSAKADPGAGAKETGTSTHPADRVRLLAQTRPALGGNLMATIVCPAVRPQMATVRPGVFAAPAADPVRQGRIEYVDPGEAPASVLEILSSAKKTDDAGVAGAEILLVAGKGIGSRKNLKKVFELAELMGAKVGVSRPLIDMGWAEYPHQVGQTGASVAPKLLVSLGVSGAIQHLAGINGAQTVIAVNTDEDAPIMKRADYVIVGDCVAFTENMIEILSKQ